MINGDGVANAMLMLNLKNNLIIDIDSNHKKFTVNHLLLK